MVGPWRRKAEPVPSSLLAHRRSRSRKLLEGVAPGFEHVPPVWELRVGGYRVLYDVDVHRHVVWIRAVRFKDRESTEDVL
jgi:mRNA-degrading endonuclease RelE of RelBE toxin-antitoxin system